MNLEWKYGKLNDAVNKASSNISLNKIQKESGDYPVFGAKGFVKSVSFFQQQSEYLAIIKDGAGIGRVSKHPAQSSVLATMQYIIPKEEYDIDFVRYFLESLDFEEYRTGSTIPHIYFKDYKNAKFPLVGYNEQKQIVAILDEAFEAIDRAKANIEKNIQNAKELFQSKLNEIFTLNADGWEQKRLPDIALEFGRGKSKQRPRNDERLFGGDFPFVQTGDVRNVDKFITSYSQTYNEIGLKQSKLWPKGTICITIAANIAETAILDFEGCFPDSIIGLVVDENIANRDYAFYALQFMKAELQAQGKGSAQDNINLGTFQSQYFPFPELLIQEKMVQIMDDIQNKCTLIENIYMMKLETLDELKKSILQKAFDGELTNETLQIIEYGKRN